MSEILQYKALSNKIEDALNDKVIGDVHVEYSFDPSAFDKTIIVAIDDPYKNQVSYYYRNPIWHCKIKLDEFIIKNSFDNEEGMSKLISEIVNTVLDMYKEHIYKRYFFD